MGDTAGFASEGFWFGFTVNREQNPQRFTTGVLFSPHGETAHCTVMKREWEQEDNEAASPAG